MQFNAVPTTSRFIVFDIEFLTDNALFERYSRADPRPCERARWPMRRLIAATVLSLSIEDGIVSVEDFRSFSGPEEAAVSKDLFSYFEERPTHLAVSWGGLATDSNILRCASMEHGLKLPRQLRPGERDRGGYCHLDLAVSMKAGAGAHVHMLELAMRIGAPCKFGPSAMAIPKLVARGHYRPIEWTSESDVVTTAWILCSHLATVGEVISADAAHYTLLRHVRMRRGQAPYSAYLGNVMDRLRRRMDASLSRWMAEAA